MDQVRVVWDAVTVMEGTIRKCALEQSGNAWRWSIEACDILQPLEGALCFSPSGGVEGALNANISGGSAEACPAGWALPPPSRRCWRMPASTASSLPTWASTCPCPPPPGCGIRRSPATCMPACCARCWPAVPAWCAGVDYTGDAPVIRVADGADLPVTTLDRVKTGSPVSSSPPAGPGPPAVGVVLTAGNQAYQSQAATRGVPAPGGCVTVQVAVSPDSPDDDEPQGSESPVWDFTKPVVEVTGHKLPTNDVEGAIYWRRKIPSLPP